MSEGLNKKPNATSRRQPPRRGVQSAVDEAEESERSQRGGAGVQPQKLVSVDERRDSRAPQQPTLDVVTSVHDVAPSIVRIPSRPLLVALAQCENLDVVQWVNKQHEAAIEQLTLMPIARRITSWLAYHADQGHSYDFIAAMNGVDANIIQRIKNLADVFKTSSSAEKRMPNIREALPLLAANGLLPANLHGSQDEIESMAIHNWAMKALEFRQKSGEFERGISVSLDEVVDIVQQQLFVEEEFLIDAGRQGQWVVDRCVAHGIDGFINRAAAYQFVLVADACAARVLAWTFIINLTNILRTIYETKDDGWQMEVLGKAYHLTDGITMMLELSQLFKKLNISDIDDMPHTFSAPHWQTVQRQCGKLVLQPRDFISHRDCPGTLLLSSPYLRELAISVNNEWQIRRKRAKLEKEDRRCQKK